MKKNITFILFLAFYSSIFSQENNPELMSEKFFNLYKSKNISGAFDYIFSTNNLISKEDIKSLKDEISQYESVLGTYYGKELFVKKEINQTIHVHSYILKYETQPIRFTLTFYNPNTKWKIQNFKINDDFMKEIESATIKQGYNKI